MSNSKINKNSITPNGIQIDSEGYAVFYPMGTNKINIPSNSPHWPKGSKLKGLFVYDKDDKLVGFCDTKAMISEDKGIVVMPYEHIDTEFDSIEKDSIQIHAPKANYKKASWTDSEKIDIPDVEYKYKGCKNGNDIKAVDANYLENDIIDGKWTELLSDMTNTRIMFYINEKIVSFSSDLSSLIDGSNMFVQCPNISTFDSDLSSLTNGSSMFVGCRKLSSFHCSDLSSLANGNYMFQFCPNLTSFTSSLNSLTSAQEMFHQCKLDALSIKNIIETINAVTESQSIVIGMGCNNNTTDKDLFAQEVGYSDMSTLLQRLQSKGWTVGAQFNGRPSSNYSLRQLESLPVYVKLVEAILTDENSFYEYTSLDGSKFYNLDWFHETTGSTEGYKTFQSLEEAITHYNIKPIEK